MAIKRENPRKAPSQNPVDFYKGKQQGGADGKASRVPERLQGGPMREKLYKRGM